MTRRARRPRGIDPAHLAIVDPTTGEPAKLDQDTAVDLVVESYLPREERTA